VHDRPIPAVPAEAAVTASTRTDPEDIPLREEQRARLGRRVIVGALVLFLAAGAFDLLGSRTAEASAEASGYRLTVIYPSITRPGLPIRWEFEVDHARGFDGPIRLATTFDYLHLFDISNFEPDATSATASGGDLIYEFDPPGGDSFRVSMDGNTEPGFHELPSATTTLYVDGRPVVAVTYSTKVVP
jgi:hypothetical protein